MFKGSIKIGDLVASKYVGDKPTIGMIKDIRYDEEWKEMICLIEWYNGFNSVTENTISLTEHLHKQYINFKKNLDI